MCLIVVARFFPAFLDGGAICTGVEVSDALAWVMGAGVADGTAATACSIGVPVRGFADWLVGVKLTRGLDKVVGKLASVVGRFVPIVVPPGVTVDALANIDLFGVVTWVTNPCINPGARPNVFPLYPTWLPPCSLTRSVPNITTLETLSTEKTGLPAFNP